MSSIHERRLRAKELHEEGYDVAGIAEIMGVSKSSVYDALAITGILLPRIEPIDESKLIYADNKVKIEKIVVAGKIYSDVTPIFAPR